MSTSTNPIADPTTGKSSSPWRRTPVSHKFLFAIALLASSTIWTSAIRAEDLIRERRDAVRFVRVQAQQGFTIMIAEGPGVRLGQVQMNEVIVTLQEFSDDASESDEDAFDGRESPGEGPAKIAQGTPDDFVFGEGSTATKAEFKLNAMLDRQMDRIDRMCKLTDEQKNKIKLAGRGDVKRLLQRAEVLKTKFKTCDQLQTVDQLRDWATDLSTESQGVRTNLTSGTFVHGSLFAKTLNAVLTPEQSAKLDRRLFNPVAPSNIQGGGIF